MNDIFCIISAIAVDYGVFSYHQRLEQLKETITSIKKYKPDAFICLMEVSDNPIPLPDLVVLESLVDQINILSEHKFIKGIVTNLDDTDTNLTARKTIGELVGILEFLGWLRTQSTNFKRVYKISGRLILNDEFIKIDHSILSNKVAVTKRYWYDRYAYLIQLWSFDFVLLDKIFDLFVQIWDSEMHTLKTYHTLNIIETMLYEHINKSKIEVEELPGYIGVEGFHGQDGVKVYV